MSTIKIEVPSDKTSSFQTRTVVVTLVDATEEQLKEFSEALKESLEKPSVIVTNLEIISHEIR